MLTSITRWLRRPFRAGLQGRGYSNSWPYWRRIVLNVPGGYLPVRDIDMLIATSQRTAQVMASETDVVLSPMDKVLLLRRDTLGRSRAMKVIEPECLFTVLRSTVSATFVASRSPPAKARPA